MVDGPAADAQSPSWRAALFHGMSAAVVAVFCYATAKLIPWPETYWAPIAAVVVLYPDPEGTKRAALQRFFGTIVGSLIGWGCAAWWHQNVLFYGLAVLVAVGLCYLLRLAAAARLSAVAVSVITIIPRTEAAHLVALHRFVEVSYGVACALAYTVALDWVRGRARRQRGRPRDAG